MTKIIAIAALLIALVAGVLITLAGTNTAASEVLVPVTANEVEACFDLADAIHEQRGGESAYNVCSQNADAYEAWKALQ